MYVPSIARQLHLDNQEHFYGKDFAFPLAGIGLGNGLMQADVQGPAVIDYAYWHGLIDEKTRGAVHAEFEHCMKKQQQDHRRKRSSSDKEEEEEPYPFHKFNVPDDCGIMEGVLYAAGAGGAWSVRPDGPNTYEYVFCRRFCSLCFCLI